MLVKYLIILIFSLINSSYCCRGCIELDDLTFDKVLKKFKSTLVKFDQIFAYGEKHEVYTDFSQQFQNKSFLAAHSDVLIATVGVKDYGDLENKVLADKFGIKFESLPVIKLFNDDNLERPVDFEIEKDEKLTVAKIFQFLKKHSTAYIKAPGCIEVLDRLAKDFMLRPHSERGEILDKAKEAVDTINLKTKKKNLSEFYLTIMKSLLEKGNDFIEHQRYRMAKLMSEDKVSKEKVDEIGKKLNVLMSFEIYMTNPSKHEEL